MMAEEESTLRQRKPQAEKQPEEKETTSKPKKTISSETDEVDDYTPWVDVLRVLSFLLVLSCGASYVISGGESWWWGMKHKPPYMTVDYWKEKIQGPPPPIYLTLDELEAYDGTDADKPLYIGLNGTIFDVSKGRHIYGPGGSYHVFAGVDAARAFITGCFLEDQTADLRGVEEVFLPLDDPEIDAHWSEEELAKLRVEELEAAKEKAHDALSHWVRFFNTSRKYRKVGYVVREEGWLEKEKPKVLCEQAQKGRKKRTIPSKDDESKEGE